MIYKEADDRSRDLNTLRVLAERSALEPDVRKRIEQEIKKLRAGLAGERAAAYEMKVSFGETPHWAVLHDLRLQYHDLYMQLDHVLINQWLDVWVCESKHVSEGFVINEQGEFTGFYAGKPYGVPSPLEQNSKHVQLLRKLFEAKAVVLPSRFGITLQPQVRSLVLVSKNARITRPKTGRIAGLDTLIKLDQLGPTVDTLGARHRGLTSLFHFIGKEPLRAVALQLAGLHRPANINWADKFGVSQEEGEEGSGALTAIASLPPSAEWQARHTHLHCHDCHTPLLLKEARYCWANKDRFKGQIYCRACQQAY